MRVLTTLLLVYSSCFVPSLYGQSPLLYHIETTSAEVFDMVSEQGLPTLYYNYGEKVYTRKALSASGSIWDSPIPIIDEKISAIKVFSGDTYTSVIYVDDADVVKYISSTNHSRTIYTKPIIIDPKIVGSNHLDIIHVDGLPHISCFDQEREILLYSRMESTDTEKWTKPLVIDKSGASGEYVDLEIVSGLPSLAYYNFGTGRLMYAQAKNRLGSSWNRARVVDNSEDVGLYAKLSVIDNKPAIAYWDAVDYALKYAVAGDEKGTTWEKAMTLDDRFAGWYSSLNQVLDNTVVTYYSMKEKSLKMMVLEGDAPESYKRYPSITEPRQGMYNVAVSLENGLAMAYYDEKDKKIVYAYMSFDPQRKVELAATISASGLRIIPELHLAEGNKATVEISTVDGEWSQVDVIENAEEPILIPYDPIWGASFNTRIKVINDKSGEEWMSSPKLVSLSSLSGNISEYNNPSPSRSFQLALYNKMGKASSISIYDENYEMVYLQKYSQGKMPRQWKRTIPLEVGQTFYLTVELGDELYHDKITFSKDGTELEDITSSFRKP